MRSNPYHPGRSILLILSLSFLLSSFAPKPPGAATVKEYLKTYTTYGFSDPDPIPAFSTIYPYYRFDGFTTISSQKKWKVVELENDYIRLTILPEIGGKIWSAFDKKRGTNFLYQNSVVKFRDIAMRGPWTSGGIEVNFGIIGHTPNCATPVDYLTSINKDSSVSCIIGTLDLLTGTRWEVDIRLRHDKAWFTTTSFWHNGTSTEQPYYHWMNAAVKVSPDLEFVYPGKAYIGHEGEKGSWPFDSLGRNLSHYSENDFEGAKSYHVLGSHSDYFGIYRSNTDNGMIHSASRHDKPGKKIFVWALSDEGKIWEKLLTDTNGQYAEIQSGRLFNQNVPESSLTPFKHITFSPFQSDGWTEYWYPFANTKGVVHAGLNGVINCRRAGDSVFVAVSSVAVIADSLKIYDSTGKLLYSRLLRLQPLEVFSETVALKTSGDPAKIALRDEVFLVSPDSNRLERPLESPARFDHGSAYGLFLQSREAARGRHYAQAMTIIRESLALDPNFLPALNQAAFLQYRSMNYDSAFLIAAKALAIDAYDPAANYYYGLSALRLGRSNDAMDGFEIAGMSPSFASAALTELAKIYLKNKQYRSALEYAGKSLLTNTQNLTALQLQYVATRCTNGDISVITEKIESIDPLNHFIRFERYRREPTNENRQAFLKFITNEMPTQTLLDLSIWYYNIGCEAESNVLLALAPQDAETLYWRAFLAKETNNARVLMDSANADDAALVFPYRQETAEVMNWARSKNKDWKPAWFLALIYQFRNRDAAARAMLDSISDPPFAPFYAVRASLVKDSATRETFLKKAVTLQPQEWRYRNLLAEFYLQCGRSSEALDVVSKFYKQHPANYMTGIVYIRALMRNEKYSEAEKALGKIVVLPYENASYAHNLYRETKLMLANQLITKKQFKKALTKIEETGIWPLSLGAGKPYPDQVDDRFEHWMKWQCNSAIGDTTNANINLQALRRPSNRRMDFGGLLVANILKQTGETKSAANKFDEWIEDIKEPVLKKNATDFYRDNKGFEILLQTITGRMDQRMF